MEDLMTREVHYLDPVESKERVGELGEKTIILPGTADYLKTTFTGRAAEGLWTIGVND